MGITTSQIVLAIDALNSYARAGGMWNRPLKSCIYAMKDHVLKSLDSMGLVVSRQIFVDVKCHRCSGRGWWSGRYEEVNCRACAATGRTTLYFRESTIGRTLRHLSWTMDDIVWHTPIHCPLERTCIEPANGWHPRTKGRDLDIEQLCGALNITEPELMPPFRSSAYEAYKLHLPDAPKQCHFCRCEELLTGHAVIRGRLEWTAFACEACRLHYKSLENRYGRALIFDRFTMLAEQLSPQLQQWIDRHGGMQKVTTPTSAIYEWEAA